ncbi:MAG: sugar phosphate isomerase/epimerase [Syntrophobacteraceae bacterium]|nr:sugar phosphate isomerase/epimerase [Syntrophobacteraceae bacterium]
MKLSFSTNAFVRFSVFEAVERIAAIGFQGVEILADSPHLYPYSTSRTDLDSLRRTLDRTGLKTASINANTAVGFYGRDFWEPLFEPSIANPDPFMRKWRVDYTKICIDMAAALGCDHVSITSGRPVPGTDPSKGLDLLASSLEDILAYAQEHGVKVGMEYEPGLLIENSEELVALMDRFDSPHFGANLDVGHSHLAGEDPGSVIGRLSSRIFHVHLEDIRSRKHYHLIPGTGDMDIPAILQSLSRAGYDGFVTLELYTYPQQPEEAARRSMAYMKTIMNEYGEK